MIDAARLHALDAAAVALLGALVGPGSSGERLGAGLGALSIAAHEAGLAALAELARRLGAAQSDTAASDAPLDCQEQAAALIDFCTGRIDPDEARSLAADDPELATRLADEAGWLAILRSEAPAGDEWPADEAGPAAAAESTDEEGPAADEPLVGHDELALLAEEALGLREELGQAGADTDRYRVLGEGLARIAEACAAIGLPMLAHLIDRCGADLLRTADGFVDTEASPADDEAMAPPTQRLGQRIDRLPEALAELFASSGAQRASLPLLAGETGASDGRSAVLAAVHEELDGLQVVASRQVSVDLPADAEVDLSLDIPADADPAVVDSLLRELPYLSGQLGERIAGLAAGEADTLVDAQRLAHTLKGSANTVGVHGIAEITHRLEDLLQLLAGRSAPVSPALTDLLGDAADCVAEMCEAVAGLGPPPSSAAAVHARLVEAIVGLLDVAPPAQAVPFAGARAPAAEPLDPEAGAGSEGPVATVIAAEIGPLEASVPGPSPEPASEPGLERAAESGVRVPAALVERMLELVDEAAILVAHAREQVGGLEQSRATMRLGGEQLQDLAGELERLVDLRGMALSEQRSRQMDALELDEYSDLHTVSRRIAESGADGKLVEQQLGENLSQLHDSLARLERLQTELRDCALRTRMATFGSIAARLRRTVRQAARMAGREAVLVLEGEDTLIDAGMLAALVDPLAHLLRNAVDHGIETPAVRQAAGKPAGGEIRLQARRDGASLILLCADDGRGLDPVAITERARALGLWSPDAADADRAAAMARLRELIMRPGFSTRDQASQLSGRGIGLDVVRQAIEELGGTIDVDSDPGRGTAFSLKVPLGLASLPVMLLRAPDQSLVLALSVRGVTRIVPLDEQGADGQGPAAPDVVASIEALLGLDPEDFVVSTPTEAVDKPPARSALWLQLPDGRSAALRVPEPEPPRSVVVRPMPVQLPRVPGFDGVAVLGDGAVAPVLDPLALLVAHAEGRLRARATGPARRSTAPPAGPICLVVDDSVSVRRTTENFVRDLGFDVEGAGDGLEALERIRRRVPDLVLVDMEMPRMNGLELVRALRADPRTDAVPVIMITSRYSERHQSLALEAGVDVFLTKPYTEDALASRIQDCFAVSRKPGMG